MCAEWAQVALHDPATQLLLAVIALLCVQVLLMGTALLCHRCRGHTRVIVEDSDRENPDQQQVYWKDNPLWHSPAPETLLVAGVASTSRAPSMAVELTSLHDPSGCSAPGRNASHHQLPRAQPGPAPDDVPLCAPLRGAGTTAMTRVPLPPTRHPASFLGFSVHHASGYGDADADGEDHALIEARLPPVQGGQSYFSGASNGEAAPDREGIAPLSARGPYVPMLLQQQADLEP